MGSLFGARAALINDLSYAFVDQWKVTISEQTGEPSPVLGIVDGSTRTMLRG